MKKKEIHMEQTKRIYIAGPMRGYPDYNFPAFDAAAERFRNLGWTVVNPAEMDRERGFDETKDTPDKAFLKHAILSDLLEISTCDAIAVLPGWERSKGANAEISLAIFLNLDIRDAVTTLPLDESRNK